MPLPPPSLNLLLFHLILHPLFFCFLLPLLSFLWLVADSRVLTAANSHNICTATKYRLCILQEKKSSLQQVSKERLFICLRLSMSVCCMYVCMYVSLYICLFLPVWSFTQIASTYKYVLFLWITIVDRFLQSCESVFAYISNMSGYLSLCSCPCLSSCLPLCVCFASSAFVFHRTNGNKLNKVSVVRNWSFLISCALGVKCSECWPWVHGPWLS